MGLRQRREKNSRMPSPSGPKRSLLDVFRATAGDGRIPTRKGTQSKQAAELLRQRDHSYAQLLEKYGGALDVEGDENSEGGDVTLLIEDVTAVQARRARRKRPRQR